MFLFIKIEGSFYFLSVMMYDIHARGVNRPFFKIKTNLWLLTLLRPQGRLVIMGTRDYVFTKIKVLGRGFDKITQSVSIIQKMTVTVRKSQGCQR